ncbi:MAG: hypothetical protein VW455_04095 [Nitrospinota bacterium]
MIKIFFFLAVFAILGCGESTQFESFSHDTGKGKEEFQVDSEICLKEKDKYSNKIQGREFGFEGQDTGYLGCMKIKGWSKKSN